MYRDNFFNESVRPWWGKQKRMDGWIDLLVFIIHVQFPLYMTDIQSVLKPLWLSFPPPHPFDCFHYHLELYISASNSKSCYCGSVIHGLMQNMPLQWLEVENYIESKPTITIRIIMYCTLKAYIYFTQLCTTHTLIVLTV